ncbi:MAG: PH domain-containing protein [Gammaproteobacteria bacterium]
MKEEQIIWSASPSQWTHVLFYILWLGLVCAPLIGFWYLHYQGNSLELTAFLEGVPDWVFLGGQILSLLVATGGLLVRYILTRLHRYELSNQRFMETTGILTRVTQELELYRVKDYEVVRPFPMNLLGLGNITMVTADVSDPEVVVYAISDPLGVKDLLRRHVEQERETKGARQVDYVS